MSFDLHPLVAATVPAVVASFVTFLLMRSQGRRDREVTRRHGAAVDLTGPLREMRRLVRGHGLVELGDREVPEAFIAWFDAFDRQHTRLPDGWGHLGRSIRSAVGVVFGASSFVDLRPDVFCYRLEEPDSLWQTFADDYLGYCIDALSLWGDDHLSAPKMLMDYDVWLVRTGRREPIGQNRVA
jgi:hypothetical protein